MCQYKITSEVVLGVMGADLIGAVINCYLLIVIGLSIALFGFAEGGDLLIMDVDINNFNLIRSMEAKNSSILSINSKRIKIISRRF